MFFHKFNIILEKHHKETCVEISIFDTFFKFSVLILFAIWSKCGQYKYAKTKKKM